MISQSPKLALVLERLGELADREGFALVGPDGTLLFSKFEGEAPSEALIAIADVIAFSNAVALSASTSPLNQMQVEWRERILLVYKHPGRGFYVVLMGLKKMNIGMAKMLVKEVAPALEQIFDALKLPVQREGRS